MATQILQTKLHVPGARVRAGGAQHVHRQRLLEMLNAGVTRKLTLVCAPAGFGKSTLLSAWTLQFAPRRVAWLSLDESDNDPVRFWTHVVAALQTSAHAVDDDVDDEIDEALGETTALLLQSPQLLPVETLLTPLLNDLARLSDPTQRATPQLAFILDDYHVIDNGIIHQGIRFLLDRLPPPVHLIISSRADPPWPLARLRGQDQLTELRTDDLRFTPDETTEFLHETMALDLSAAEIGALDTRTEGWIAGLQLVGLSLRGAGDPARFIAQFSGTNRYIVDYLVEEVLARQDETTQRFLLQSSILDRLCGALCDAVIDASADAGHSQFILEELEHANLFLIPLDNNRTWYRYHHLFAEVLRHRLRHAQPDNLAELHRRASLWYEEHAEPEAAVRHALQVPDVTRAARLVEAVALEMLLHRSEVWRARGLLEQLPQEVIHARPHLVMAYEIMLLLFGRFAEIAQLLAAAASTLSAPDLPAEIVGGMLVIEASSARFRGELALARALAHRALAELPTTAYTWRAAALLTVGMIHMRDNEFAQGQLVLNDTYALCLTHGIEYLALVSLSEIATEQIRRGQLVAAKQTSETGINQVQRWARARFPAVGLVEIHLGEILCEWNEVDAALAVLTPGVQTLQGTAETPTLLRGYVALARAQAAKGHLADALHTVRQAEAWILQSELIVWDAQVWLLACVARLQIRQGDLAAAAQWVPTVAPGETSGLGYYEQFTLIRLWLAQYATGGPRRLLNDAAGTLDLLLPPAIDQSIWSLVIEGYTLRALVYQAQGQLAPACDALLTALTYAVPEGYTRLFVDEGVPIAALLRALRRTLAQRPGTHTEGRTLAHIDKVLAALDAETGSEVASAGIAHASATISPAAPPLATMVEQLTDRELEILRLVCAGLSNRELATTLIVSIGTIKKHLNNIFGKLGVSSRTQAIARARSLELL